ncbi:2,4-dienoyl-CoA reductase-like NADH-dependent reductase (Old Yellow Enzyme family) [Paraburkholderia eburnea]|uniref:2,4-dienoyl-CoA reductase-like NADH-dependent reductase (Old Yellow Enzyme family) n=1 Tax=Paraburkholderia eburnea TaxID=1189126 RepID=A0A2S4M7V7_9BURK|nr:12-oxophytodienoate reductase [Paraburkholderia eburnea]POR50689.1 2,4-dienoyl-CoA reductase-like NADH-dependent reductase (Old Yellow Enzyme family) [Paraburkholderia eburnea]PRZ21457.1 2,4-dienoyl-CoA reductase-like NADH-dependent reductase (Old Yellow Enzyme family) [Paraburkholderia eburnea]
MQNTHDTPASTGPVEAIPASHTAKLFEPVQAGSLRLGNRIVMSPMTRTMAPDGVPGEANAAYYRKRAAGGAGLIITEGTWIPHDAAANEADVPKMYGVPALAGWKKVVDAVHAEATPIIAQLWHVGQMKQHTVDGLYAGKGAGYRPPRRVGPSGLFGGIGKPTTLDGEPAVTADLEAIVEAYGKAAINAKMTGFDGIELHAAHGYLLDQFLWPGTNRRTDEWGGSLANRARLVANAVAEIRRMTGPDFAISLRISQWKVQDFKARNFETPEALEAFARLMVDAGVDVFHCSTRRFWDTEFGSDRNLAAWTKQVSGKPTITVGSVGMTGEHIDTLMGEGSSVAALDYLLALVDRGDFDLVAVGRGMLVDPDWANKVRDGRIDQLRDWDPEVLKDLV